MRTSFSCMLLALLAGAGMFAQTSSNVVVLRGGEVIQLREPWVVKGSNAILTKSDGTLLSVPVSEIDQKATAARKAAPPPPATAQVVPPPSTPAEAVRANKNRPHARLRISDADVAHQPVPEAESKEKGGDAAPGMTAAKIEVADYTQNKSGGRFTVRGAVRNVGATAATSVRLTVYVLDDKGEPFEKRDATLDSSRVEAGHSASFVTAFDIGEKSVAALRFQPIWISAPLPPPAGAAAPAGSASAPRVSAPVASGSTPSASSAPPPAPTPYGQGLYFAAPAPPAASTAPADGNTGYIPGATRPEDQPKPPE